jgi:hypothetical protein
MKWKHYNVQNSSTFFEYVQESKCQNHAYIYAKNVQHRNVHDHDETGADHSVPAGPSTSQVSEAA